MAQGLKTISLRIIGTEAAKAELEELGENVDDFVVQTQSKLDHIVRDYTAVASNDFKGISLLDENGNYRSTYEILVDISEIYQEILATDKEMKTNRGQALLELLAGKNRSNILASILDNPELLKEAYETALDSEGSAQKELDARLDSISIKLNQLQNAWQKLWSNAIDSELIKSVIDLGTELVKLIDNVGLLTTALGGLSVAFGLKKIGGTRSTLLL